MISTKQLCVYTLSLWIKPTYRYVKSAESAHDLQTLNSCMYMPFKLSNPHTYMKLLTCSFTTHQTIRLNPSIDIHNKTCARHKYYRSNQSIINIVISVLLDLIHHQILKCVLSFRSKNSLTTHYMHDLFRSNYEIFINCT